MTRSKAWNIASSPHLSRYKMETLIEADTVLRQRRAELGTLHDDLLDAVIKSLSDECQRRLTTGAA